MCFTFETTSFPNVKFFAMKPLPILSPVLLFAFLFISPVLNSQSLPSKQEVVSVLKKVNESWMDRNPDPGNNQWARAAYFTGNLDFYKGYPKQQYLDYTNLWANKNSWALNGGSSTRNADNQCIGQVYIDLYKMDNPPVPEKIDRINRSMARMVESDKSDDWWWIDALYMAMPIFTRLGVLLNNEAYFEKMYSLYYNTKISRGLYNKEIGLWYRDESFAPPYTTPNGKPSYWSRGNGWVFAAHVRVLQLLPENDPHRSEYIETFKEMALALQKCQREDGFWNVSLGDPNNFGGPETSGTSFFTYGFAWGINNGLLDSATFAPIVAHAWNGLITKAVHDDGFLGYVQGVGTNPSSSQPVTHQTTADFGVGAFLLAGSEVAKLAPGLMPQPSNFYIDSVVVSGAQNISVWFNREIDPVSGVNPKNYTIEGVEIQNVSVVGDERGVLLTVAPLKPGKYRLVTGEIKDREGKALESEVPATFYWSGNIMVIASSFEAGTDNKPERTLDFDLNTRWSAEGVGQWIQYDLGSLQLVTSVDIAWYKGNERYSKFAISLSEDGEKFVEVFNSRSSGTTLDLENFNFTDTKARLVKITGFGNSASLWNSITEVRINTLTSSVPNIPIGSGQNPVLFPNPYSNKGLTINTTVEPGKAYCAKLTDLQGNIVARKIIIPFTHSSLSWPELVLPRGLFFLWIDEKPVGKILIN
jgi:rhamnogalacturonyl hydrolase YesR